MSVDTPVRAPEIDRSVDIGDVHHLLCHCQIGALIGDVLRGQRRERRAVCGARVAGDPQPRGLPPCPMCAEEKQQGGRCRHCGCPYGGGGRGV